MHGVNIFFSDSTVVGSSLGSVAAVFRGGGVFVSGGWSLRVRGRHEGWAGVGGLDGWRVPGPVARGFHHLFGLGTHG